MTLSATLRAAASDIGYHETGNNITRYWARWKPTWQGSPWCAAAVTDWLSRGGELEEFNGQPIFYCPYVETLAKTRRRWYTTPQVGDLVLFSFGSNEAIHIGIVEKVNATTIQTIEGNTSPTGSGSQNNGGGVYRRIRSRGWGIRGYYRPAYDAPPIASPIPNLPKRAKDPARVTKLQNLLEVTADGQWGNTTDDWAVRMRTAARAKAGSPRVIKAFKVSAVQRVIDTGTDGTWGPRSQAALIAWIKDAQHVLRVTADGEWGPKTDAAFLKLRSANRNRF